MADATGKRELWRVLVFHHTKHVHQPPDTPCKDRHVLDASFHPVTPHIECPDVFWYNNAKVTPLAQGMVVVVQYPFPLPPQEGAGADAARLTYVGVDGVGREATHPLPFRLREEVSYMGVLVHRFDPTPVRSTKNASETPPYSQQVIRKAQEGEVEAGIPLHRRKKGQRLDHYLESVRAVGDEMKAAAAAAAAVAAAQQQQQRQVLPQQPRSDDGDNDDDDDEASSPPIPFPFADLGSFNGVGGGGGGGLGLASSSVADTEDTASASVVTSAQLLPFPAAPDFAAAGGYVGGAAALRMPETAAAAEAAAAAHMDDESAATAEEYATWTPEAQQALLMLVQHQMLCVVAAEGCRQLEVLSDALTSAAASAGGGAAAVAGPPREAVVASLAGPVAALAQVAAALPAYGELMEKLVGAGGTPSQDSLIS